MALIRKKANRVFSATGTATGRGTATAVAEVSAELEPRVAATLRRAKQVALRRRQRLDRIQDESLRRSAEGE